MYFLGILRKVPQMSPESLEKTSAYFASSIINILKMVRTLKIWCQWENQYQYYKIQNTYLKQKKKKVTHQFLQKKIWDGDLSINY